MPLDSDLQLIPRFSENTPFAWEPVLEKAWAVVLRRLKALGGSPLTKEKRVEILRVGDDEIDKAVGEQATRLGTELAAKGDATSSFGMRLAQQHKRNVSRAKKELRLEVDAFLKRVADFVPADGNATPSNPLSRTSKRKQRGRKPANDTPNFIKLSAQAKALAILVEHPEWTDTRIAKAVPCSRTTLYRWPRFREARAAMKVGRASMSRGSKYTGENVESWDE